jgi:hypothetical protein
MANIGIIAPNAVTTVVGYVHIQRQRTTILRPLLCPTVLGGLQHMTTLTHILIARDPLLGIRTVLSVVTVVFMTFGLAPDPLAFTVHRRLPIPLHGT